jgi:hypothetical protein
MKMIIIITVLILIIITITGIFAISNARTETQKYEVLYKKKNFEIRYYPEAILATIEMNGTYDNSRNSGFRILAGYIFGNNKDKSKIAMTSPVRMSGVGQINTMSFVLPSEMEFEKLPVPNDSNVILHQSKPMYTASLRFGGYASDTEISKYEAELIDILKQLNFQHSNQIEYLGYNPPYQMINRRNEVHLQLTNFNLEMLPE